MCNSSCVEFAKKNIKPSDIKNRTVIEVGSRNINGSLRSVVETFGPAAYLGVDIQSGQGVDAVCAVENLIEKFGRDKFDALICTELLEHVRDWKKAIHNIKNVVKPGGILLITTRSKGFEYHGFPFDFWRYQKSDFEYIFSDFNIEALENDPQRPGVLLKAGKPTPFDEKKIAHYELYSIIKGRKASVGAASIDWLILVLPLFKIFGRSKFFAKAIRYNAEPFNILKRLKQKLTKVFLG